MQIFFTSRNGSSYHTSFLNKEKCVSRGFTLIELLISVAIIGIITAIVLVKYSSFDSTTLLKAAAYEVALNLREAQVKSVSVVRNDDENNSFDQPYGISFTPRVKTYQMFRYNEEFVVPPKPNPQYDVGENSPKAVKISEVSLDRGMYVEDVCIQVGKSEDCTITRLDISFRRPEFSALFYVPVPNFDQSTISKAIIKMSSANNEDASFIIEVTRLGQISINLTP